MTLATAATLAFVAGIIAAPIARRLARLSWPRPRPARLDDTDCNLTRIVRVESNAALMSHKEG